MTAAATSSEFTSQATAKAPAPAAADAQGQSSAFALVFVGSFLAAMAAFYIINILGNATQLFDSRINPSMQERPWKTRRLDEKVAAGQAPKVIVIGSSRSMQIRPQQLEYLTGKPAFNYGVSVSNPLDYLTQLRYLLKIGAKPDMIIVGVDEDAFGAPRQYIQFDTQLVAHWGLLRAMPSPEGIRLAGQAIASITPSKTLDSLLAIVSREKGPELKKSTDAVIFGDGYLIYRVRERTRAKLEADSNGDEAKLTSAIRTELSKLIRHEINRRGHEIEKQMLTPDPRQVELFDQFLTLAHDNSIEVRVMLLPLHPAYVKGMLDADLLKMRSDLGTRIAGMSKDHGCTYTDFTNLKSYGGDPDEFWDAKHQTPANLQRMINTLFGRKPEDPVPNIRPDLDTIVALERELKTPRKKGSPPPTVSTLTTR